MDIYTIIGKVAFTVENNVYSLKKLKQKDLETVETVDEPNEYGDAGSGYCIVKYTEPNADPVFVKFPFSSNSDGHSFVNFSQAKIVKGKAKTITVWEIEK